MKNTKLQSEILKEHVALERLFSGRYGSDDFQEALKNIINKGEKSKFFCYGNPTSYKDDLGMLIEPENWDDATT